MRERDPAGTDSGHPAALEAQFYLLMLRPDLFEDEQKVTEALEGLIKTILFVHASPRYGGRPSNPKTDELLRNIQIALYERTFEWVGPPIRSSRADPKHFDRLVNSGITRDRDNLITDAVEEQTPFGEFFGKTFDFYSNLRETGVRDVISDPPDRPRPPIAPHTKLDGALGAGPLAGGPAFERLGGALELASAAGREFDGAMRDLDETVARVAATFEGEVEGLDGLLAGALGTGPLAGALGTGPLAGGPAFERLGGALEMVSAAGREFDGAMRDLDATGARVAATFEGEVEGLDALLDGLKRGEGEVDEFGASLTELKDIGRRAFAGLEGALGEFIRTGKFEWRDLARVALGAIGDIFDAQIKAAGGASSGGGGIGGFLSGITGALGGLFGGGGGATPFADAAAAAGIFSPFEHGGRFAANQPILVGEAGPELLVPPMAGEIVPNHALAGGAPQQPVNQKFVINISPGVPEAVRAHFAAAMSIPLDHSARFVVG